MFKELSEISKKATVLLEINTDSASMMTVTLTLRVGKNEKSLNLQPVILNGTAEQVASDMKEVIVMITKNSLSTLEQINALSKSITKASDDLVAKAKAKPEPDAKKKGAEEKKAEPVKKVEEHSLFSAPVETVKVPEASVLSAQVEELLEQEEMLDAPGSMFDEEEDIFQDMEEELPSPEEEEFFENQQTIIEDIETVKPTVGSMSGTGIPTSAGRLHSFVAKGSLTAVPMPPTREQELIEMTEREFAVSTIENTTPKDPMEQMKKNMGEPYLNTDGKLVSPQATPEPVQELTLRQKWDAFVELAKTSSIPIVGLTFEGQTEQSIEQLNEYIKSKIK